MAEIVTFPSSIDIKTATLTPIGTTETDLVVLKSPDLDSTSVVSPSGNTQATLWIDFVKGSLTDATFRIYSSADGVNWYPEQVVTPGTGGQVTLDDIYFVLSADAKKIYHFSIGAVRAVKVTAQGSGTTTGSSVTASISLRTN